MSSPFVAEIRMFAGNFAPTGWALCNGQILPISQNTALFSLLGTTYGGNGQSTFALPNLQGSSPMHQGQGAGLTDRVLGETSGSEFVTLLTSEIPVHTHQVQGNFNVGDLFTPSATTVLANSDPGSAYSTAGSIVQMSPQAATAAGGSLPHNNMMPYLVVVFIIAMQGVFPARP